MDPSTPVAMLVSPARTRWRNLPQPALGSGQNCAGFATADWRTLLVFPGQGSWGDGRGEAGYGDGDELNLISFGSSETAKCITQYFRSTFEVDDPALYDSLVLQLLVDDGAVVYINGHTVLNHNLLFNPTMNTKALVSVTGAAEYTFNLFGISSEWLVPGTNLIAVEVHQRSATDADMSFNLELDGVLAPVDTSGGTTGTTGGFDSTTSAEPSVARTTVFLPSLTATIDESHPFTNYGSDAQCKVDGVAPGGAGGASIACLAKWDVSGIPQGAIIRAVHVVANVEDASPEYFQVWALNSAWNQPTVAWGDSDMSLSGDWTSPNGVGFEFGFNDYSDQEFPWALTIVNSPGVGELIFTLPPSLVQQWIVQPELAHGIAIYNPEKSNQIYFTATDPGLQLVVTYDEGG